MVYNGTSHLEMGDDWGYPHDSGNHHLYLLSTSTTVDLSCRNPPILHLAAGQRRKASEAEGRGGDTQPAMLNSMVDGDD